MAEAAVNDLGRDVIADYKLANSINLGSRIFHSECRACHGAAAKGTSYAPSLVKLSEKLTSRQFADRVLKGHASILGYSEVTGDERTTVRQAFVELLKKQESSQVVMPAWEDNPVVSTHIENLYQYLRALGDGTLEPDSLIQNGK